MYESLYVHCLTLGRRVPLGNVRSEAKDQLLLR